MLEFSGELPHINFDRVAYTKKLDKTMGLIVREAARQWLRAILLSIPSRGGFPVLTGAAKSTLVPLGRFLRVAVPVTPTVGVRDGRYRGDRRAEGADSSEFEIVDDKNGGIDNGYSFEWSSDLLHYYINEFYTSNVPEAPWHTLEKGEQAFYDYVDWAIANKLPDIELE